MTNLFHLFGLWLCFICLYTDVLGQKVLVSPELNMRNDFAYYIIHGKNEQVHLVRDKSYRLTIQSLSNSNEWTTEIPIELKGRKWKVMEVIAHQSEISIFYHSIMDQNHVLFHSKYKANGELVNEDTIHFKKLNQIKPSYKIKISANQSKICFGYLDQDHKHHVVLYDRFKNKMLYDTCVTDLLHYDDNSVNEIELSDEGEIFLIGEIQEKKFIKKKIIYRLSQISTIGSILSEKDIYFDEFWPLDLKMKFNPLNKKLCISGLSSERNSETPIGFYSVLWDTNENEAPLVFHDISSDLFKEWTGKDKKKSVTNNLLTESIHFTDSGNMLVFYESNKELTRKPYFNSVAEGPLNVSRWTDYYYEDILAINFSADQNIAWQKVLHKKQFSQDDDGLFSSFFVLSTSDYLRIIFNDEIKNESTVSEYILLPTGEYLRKSILNTTSQNLYLRIKDAVQINANTLLVPSESNGKMNLVRISFEE